MLCLSVFVLSGCTQAEIDQTQYDKMINNMQETIQQLKDQNQQLTNLYNQQSLTETAWNLYKTADSNFILNINGVRDNVIIKSTAHDTNHATTQTFYTGEDGTQIYMKENMM